MKIIFRIVLVLILQGFLSIQIAKCQNELQSGRIIPVYPGAVLNTELEEGDSKMCCNFVSGDNFDKVIAFYENTLKIKSLDPKSLAEKLPFLKQQVEMLLQQMPPGMKIKFFVLKEVEFQGQKGAELFEVYTSLKGVQFSITESQLEDRDQHFTSEFGIETSGNPKSTDPQLIIKALPSEVPAGYTKDEVTIDQMPDNPTSVSVGYNKLLQRGTGGENGTMDKTSNIFVIISDAAPEYYEEMIKPQSPNEKAVTIKGKYKGVEVMEKNEYGCQGAGVRFVVNDKFLVEISESALCDIKILYQVVDKMNLEILPK